MFPPIFLPFRNRYDDFQQFAVPKKEFLSSELPRDDIRRALSLLSLASFDMLLADRSASFPVNHSCVEDRQDSVPTVYYAQEEPLVFQQK